ncbi:MAG: signal peptidase I [Lachnospiraceae bacterium]|jgi:signal peptidase|nr:signal peptidase I [Lachnospiraceae bacterium]
MKRKTFHRGRREESTVSSGSFINKIIHVIERIIWFILILCVIFAVIFAVRRATSKEPLATTFGFAPAIIMSGSMEPALHVDDMVIIRKSKTYKPGEIATYVNENNSLITHRIKKITDEGFIFKGDANNVEDGIVNRKNVVGRVVFRVPMAGKIFSLNGVIILFALVVIFVGGPIIWDMLNRENKVEENKKDEE